jgi:glutamate formiminotransferase
VVIVESVPNISEGRSPDIIAACAAAVRAGGAAMLDLHTDADHHRSVLTFAGDRAAVRDSALRLVERAVALIDLRTHSGVHPRMGAVDVMPFVPLVGCTLDEAAALAREVGEEVAARFDVPVFLYEAAATAPARSRLEAIRRGQFEALAGRLSRPEWAPDFGRRAPHPSAGVIAIGARQPLIAFNVVLDSNRLDVARAIATSVRERDGGLPGVKALGLPLASRGLVQVSLNLIDYRITPPVVVFDRIVEVATAHDVTVLESELVGLAPEAALPSAPRERLRLSGPPGIYSIEGALRHAGLSSRPSL